VARSNLIIGIGGAGNQLLEALLRYHPKIEKIADEIRIDTESAEKEGLLKKQLGRGVKNVFLFAGLGGEVGGRVTVDLAGLLKAAELSPYVVGIIPASRRADRDSINLAYKALNELKTKANGVIIVDNEKLSHLPYFENYYDRYNAYVVSILSDILEAESIDAVLKTLSFEDGAGYAAVARASELTKGALGYILPIIPHRDIDIRTMLRVALEKLTLFDNPIGSKKGAAIINVPEERANRIDQGLVEDLMQTYTNESMIDIKKTRRNITSITTIFTYSFEEFRALRKIGE
jgi:cell division GTPase FtsZ